jgi:hypothetical protein
MVKDSFFPHLIIILFFNMHIFQPPYIYLFVLFE